MNDSVDQTADNLTFRERLKSALHKVGRGIQVVLPYLLVLVALGIAISKFHKAVKNRDASSILNATNTVGNWILGNKEVAEQTAFDIHEYELKLENEISTLRDLTTLLRTSCRNWLQRIHRLSKLNLKSVPTETKTSLKHFEDQLWDQYSNAFGAWEAHRTELIRFMKTYGSRFYTGRESSIKMFLSKTEQEISQYEKCVQIRKSILTKLE